MGVKAFFIDKDGTIVDNSKYPDVIPTDELLLQDILGGLRLIQNRGYQIFIVSNQSAIAKGRLSFSEVERIFQNIVKKLEKYNIQIRAYVYCPHKSEDNCECKKPKTQLIDKLVELYEIDRGESFVVGDMDKDVFLAKNAGIKSVLVKTGRGVDFMHTEPDYIISNLNEIWRVLDG